MAVEFTVFDDDADGAWDISLEFANAGEQWQQGTVTWGEDDATQELPLPASSAGEARRARWQWEADGAAGEHVQVRARLARQVADHAAGSVHFGPRYSAPVRLRLYPDADRDGLWDGVEDSCEHHDLLDCDQDGATLCSGDDCDDADPLRRVGFPEVCDGWDNDCLDETWAQTDDGTQVPGEPDADGDGQRVCAGDCDDTNDRKKGALDGEAAAESRCLDGIDNDCDTAIDDLDPDCVGSGELASLDCLAGYAQTGSASLLLPFLLLVPMRRRRRGRERGPHTGALLGLVAALLLPSAAFGQSGGPDASGYTFSSTPALFVDLQALVGPAPTDAQQVAMGDDSTWVVDLAAETTWAGFPFYGNTYPFLVIDSNGKINFDPLATSDGTNDCLPVSVSTPGAEADIAVLWDDLDPSASTSGGVFTWFDAVNDRFIVSWEGVPWFGTFDEVWVQAHLFGNGDVEVHWDTVDAAGDPPWARGGGATVGIQDAVGGTQGFSNVLAYSCDSKELSDASATTFAACPDLDGDGWSTCAGDCDDSLATGLTASPDLEEVCDGIDNDCDATTIETIDSDFDGQSVCDDDCDDDNGLVYTPAPGETNETCDGFDNDCNGVVDDGFDDDGDGQYECGTDCNDEDASVYLGAPEVCDGVDQNCDGLFFTMDTSSPGTSTNTVTDALRGNRWEVSAATNLHRFTAQLDAATGTEITWRVYEGPGGAAGPWTEVASQTNTTTAPPGAAWHTSPPLLVPLAQGLAYVTAVSWTGASVTYPWSPVSGPSPVSFGSHLGGTIASSAASALADSPNSYPTQIFTDVETDTDGDGELPCEGDCDDLNASVLTSAAEVCDGLDNDCDASTTFIDPVTGLDETDADGDGDPLCGTDCDDGNASQSGTGVEICDGLDNDCDSSTQAEGGEIDGDNDLSLSCVDCDDNDASTYPGADELCDGQDQACDGIAPIILAPPDPSITSAALTETIGSRWTPPSTTFLSTVDALLTLPSGVELTWEVYEAPSPLGPWTPIASASSFPVSQGQPGWQSSPLFNITMQTGTTYAVTVTWSSSLVTYEWAPAATVLPADIAGIYEGGVAAGPSPLARQYAVRITTGVEADQDSDGALGCGGDCDDDDPATYPNAEEVCDGVDNDCDGFLPPLEDDGDGDGHIECPPVTGSALLGGDCDDANGDVYPGAAEVCDGVDNDCDNALFVDPQTGVGENADGDGDLSLICDDCDDDDSTVFPGAAELCDGLDSNCNGIAGEVVSALPPTDWMSNANPNRTRGSRWLVSEDETLTHLRAWLNAPEGSAIEWRVYVGPTPDGPWTLSQSLPDTTTGSGSGWHVSPPFDYPLVAGGSYATTVSWTTPAIRFGISTQTSRPFDVPIGQYWGPARINFSGSTLVGTNFNQFSVELIAGDEDDVDGDTYPACDDCDDDDFARNPGSVEVCDGVDNDCDGVLFVDPLTGDGETDSDGDGGMPCNGDCDDTDASVLAGGAEVCDGADNDCDGVAGFPGETIDGDGDGSLACSDCDDTDAALYPLAPETCDGTDNNCQGIQGAVSEPLPPGVPTTVNNDLRGSRWTPSGDTFINQIEAYLTAPSGSDLLWELYEGASPTGPWTAVWSGTSTTSAASPGWEVSPLIGLPLLTGTTYATTVSRTDSDVLVWYASGPTPYSVPVGTYEGGVIGSTGAFGTSTAQYSVRILADAELDNDGDGLLGCDPADCDDEDAGIAAGLAEVCDGVDNDCDGILFSDIYGDESDADGDTFFACLDDDCDDTNADSYPGADELCDLQDNDCDGFLSGAETTDVDGDGSPVCIDCDDQESTSFPGAPKLCDGLDNDCDGFVGLTVEPGPVVTGGNAIVSTGTDRFRGNVVEVTTTTLLSAVQTELNTPVGTTLTFSVLESIQGSWVTVASVQMATTQSGMRVHESPPLNQTLVAGSTYGVGVHWDLQSNYGWENNLTPLAQSFGTIVNGILQFGVPGPTGAAPTLSGLLYSVTMLTGVSEDDLDGDGVRVCAGDCDDDDQAINPGAAETCDDAIDQDCDGVVETSSDQDGDGELDEDCGGADCNDDDPLVFPSAVEACDGLDSDCDGSILGEADDDGDGFRICGGDCDDTAATINPTALVELCDGADTDCDGTIPLDEADIDGDGYRICSQPSDCNDLDAAVAPFLLDDCGDGDENCNGVVDDDCPPEESDDDDVTEPDDDDSANDLDGDGVTWPDDCDDEDDTVYPGADEICDDKDNDCDGLKLPFEADVDTDGWMRCEGDCDDSLAEVHPEAIEDCGDALDNDCNGLTDVEDEACDDAEGAPASGVTCYGCGGELASSVSGFWVLMIAGTGLRRRRRDPAESLT
ncbi:MAG: putative metal-binding motif-containing protein [Deltaproteobacteria bacterium]|nr:putative metal-binding motif-containing protein [Deltaproteobacteria bacterium]